jgi:hypothetical protein
MRRWFWFFRLKRHPPDSFGSGGVELAESSDDFLRITPCIEPLKRFETDFLNRCKHGLRRIEAIGSKAVQRRLDTFHRNIEKQNWAAPAKKGFPLWVQRLACGLDWGTSGDINSLNARPIVFHKAGAAFW